MCGFAGFGCTQATISPSRSAVGARCGYRLRRRRDPQLRSSLEVSTVNGIEDAGIVPRRGMEAARRRGLQQRRSRRDPLSSSSISSTQGLGDSKAFNSGPAAKIPRRKVACQALPSRLPPAPGGLLDVSRCRIHRIADGLVFGDPF